MKLLSIACCMDRRAVLHECMAFYTLAEPMDDRYYMLPVHLAVDLALVE